MRNDYGLPFSGVKIPERTLSRRDLCERIAAAAMKAAEYECGSVHATRIAHDKARAIRREAELLEHSLALRLMEIDRP